MYYILYIIYNVYFNRCTCLEKEVTEEQPWKCVLLRSYFLPVSNLYDVNHKKASSMARDAQFVMLYAKILLDSKVICLL